MDRIERLTPQEESIMRAFWSGHVRIIRDIIQMLPSPKPPYTTVASIVKNLEAKGYVRGVHKGRCYEYSVLITEKDYSESTVGRVVQQFFTGSYKELVQHFVAKSKISAEELREVIDLIEKGESR